MDWQALCALEETHRKRPAVNPKFWNSRRRRVLNLLALTQWMGFKSFTVAEPDFRRHAAHRSSPIGAYFSEDFPSLFGMADEARAQGNGPCSSMVSRNRFWHFLSRSIQDPEHIPITYKWAENTLRHGGAFLIARVFARAMRPGTPPQTRGEENSSARCLMFFVLYRKIRSGASTRTVLRSHRGLPQRRNNRLFNCLGGLDTTDPNEPLACGRAAWGASRHPLQAPESTKWIETNSGRSTMLVGVEPVSS